MFVIRGASLAGTEPAQTRWRNWLRSRGVGLGVSSRGGRRREGEWVGVLAGGVMGGGGSAWVLGAWLSGGRSVATGGWLGGRFVGLWGLLAAVGAERVGLSAAGNVLGEGLANVLLESGGCLPVGLVFLLLLAALSSSSDEISTTIWADIVDGL